MEEDIDLPFCSWVVGKRGKDLLTTFDARVGVMRDGFGVWVEDLFLTGCVKLEIFGEDVVSQVDATVALAMGMPLFLVV